MHLIFFPLLCTPSSYIHPLIYKYTYSLYIINTHTCTHPYIHKLFFYEMKYSLCNPYDFQSYFLFRFKRFSISRKNKNEEWKVCVVGGGVLVKVNEKESRKVPMYVPSDDSKFTSILKWQIYEETSLKKNNNKKKIGNLHFPSNLLLYPKYYRSVLYLQSTIWPFNGGKNQRSECTNSRYDPKSYINIWE